ncbi:UNVERIFIED_ORG: hypothetical protein J2Y77_000906 [Pseudomonas lini]
MGLFSSKSTPGFYDASINEIIPADAIPVTAERRRELLDGQSTGKVIDFSPDTGPVLIDPPPASPEVLATIERQWRDGRLLDTDGMVTRHRDELEEGTVTTLTADQYVELQTYRRALRDWPQSEVFPEIELRPVAPAWIAEQLQ